MSFFDQAYLKLQSFNSRLKNSNRYNKEYFKYAIPFVFHEILGQIRDSNTEHHNRNYEVSVRNKMFLMVLTLESRLKLTVSRRKDVLFVVSSSNHYQHCLALESKLLEENMTHAYVTDKAELYRRIKLTNSKVYFINNVRFYGLVSASKSIAESGDDINNHLGQIVLNHSPYFNDVERQWDVLIKRLRPKIMISGNELLLPHRIGAFMFRNNNLPVITLQHGYLSSAGIIYREMLCDKFLVYGEVAKNAMMKMGFPEDRLAVVGNLCYNPKKFSELRSDKSNQKKEKTILIVFSGPGVSTSLKHHLKQIETVMKLAEFHGNVRFVFKLHPKDRIDYYGDITLSNITVITHSEFVRTKRSFLDLIVNAHAIITSVSASMYDAFQLRVPVLVLDLDEEYISHDIAQTKTILYCGSLKELKKSFENVLHHNGVYPTVETAQNYCKELYYRNDTLDIQTMCFAEIAKLI